MRRQPALVLAFALVGTGCIRHVKTPNVRPAASTQDGSGQDALRFFPPPFALAQPDDAVVRIVGPQMNCTGTLVDEDLVLTAHHCVVVRAASGEFSKQLVTPKDLHVELGGDYLAWGHVGVSAIVAPPCGEGGGAGDIAVLVLPRKLVGIPPIPPRLGTAPHVGEELEPVGFGRCSLSNDGIRRQAREGGRVFAMNAETLHLRASICPGDSGGPVLSHDGHEVVGVISLSAMDGDDHTLNLSVVARVDTYRSVLAQARLIADGTSASELPPLACE